MQILVTGAAGFIGANITEKLLSEGHSVVGVDNLNDYYDVSLKKARLSKIQTHPDFTFKECDIVDRRVMSQLFENNLFDVVVHLAAQAGVRHSIDNPQSYIDSNLVGFGNVLEGCNRTSCLCLLKLRVCGE